jgi:hypothetical protein
MLCTHNTQGSVPASPRTPLSSDDLFLGPFFAAAQADLVSASSQAEPASPLTPLTSDDVFLGPFFMGAQMILREEASHRSRRSTPLSPQAEFQEPATPKGRSSKKANGKSYTASGVAKTNSKQDGAAEASVPEFSRNTVDSPAQFWSQKPKADAKKSKRRNHARLFKQGALALD